MREAQNLTFLWSEPLAIPKLEYRVLEVDGYSTYDFDHYKSDIRYLDILTPYYVKYLKELSGFEEMGAQISYFRNIIQRDNF